MFRIKGLVAAISSYGCSEPLSKNCLVYRRIQAVRQPHTVRRLLNTTQRSEYTLNLQTSNPNP